jgi:hypothetical protein
MGVMIISEKEAKGMLVVRIRTQTRVLRIGPAPAIMRAAEHAMTPTLRAEQRRAVAGHLDGPVRLIEPVTDRAGVLLTAEASERVRPRGTSLGTQKHPYSTTGA